MPVAPMNASEKEETMSPAISCMEPISEAPTSCRAASIAGTCARITSTSPGRDSERLVKIEVIPSVRPGRKLSSIPGSASATMGPRPETRSPKP